MKQRATESMARSRPAEEKEVEPLPHPGLSTKNQKQRRCAGVSVPRVRGLHLEQRENGKAMGPVVPRLVLSPRLTARVRLHVWPNPVFEADTLALQCWARTHTLSQVKCCKDGTFFSLSVNNSPLSIKTATARNRGNYSSRGQRMRFEQGSEPAMIEGPR